LVIKKETTGGIIWHFRAFSNKRKWNITIDLISNWLNDINPNSSELILIGASAGWMIPTKWLVKFKKIIHVDIDPFAYPLFLINHNKLLKKNGTKILSIKQDGILFLRNLISIYPKAAVFFDNVLGQHIYRSNSIETTEKDLTKISLYLKDREWGSLHDMFSGPAESEKIKLCLSKEVFGIIDEKGLLINDKYGTDLNNKLVCQVGGKGEWMDHLTARVFPNGTKIKLILWPFFPNYAHWLQLGWVN